MMRVISLLPTPLERHPEYSWQKLLLRDRKAGPWTLFQAGQKLASSFADG